MRLLDEILSGRWAAEIVSPSTGFKVPFVNLDVTELREKLPSLEVFNIDNVTEYLYAQTDQEVWDVKADFPCLAPPFPAFWMEFHRPSKIVSCVTGTQDTRAWPYAVGLLFQSTDSDADAWLDKDSIRERLTFLGAEIEQRLKAMPESAAQIVQIKRSGANPLDLRDPRWNVLSPAARQLVGLTVEAGAMKMFLEEPSKLQDSMKRMSAERGLRWLVKCNSFMQPRRHGPVYGPLGDQTLFIDQKGVVLEENSRVNLHYLTDEGWCRDGGGISTMWFSGLLAISFLHCKNVTIQREEIPVALRKRQAERGRTWTATFKTLEITPLKAVLERAASENHAGLKRALHICRGHFANYEERGLFGKYPGRFWIPQHMRGSVQQGAVLKDYKVNAKS
jgi:hypothetical protein